MAHIYAVGETILDIIFKDREPRTARPGGSSFNAAITLGRLGAPVTLISEMGMDRVGDMIRDFMLENGVDTDYLARYEEGQSAIALAFLNEKSDAEYQFYKDYPHQRLAVDFPEFNPDDLLIFGSFYALNPRIRPRVAELLNKADQAGATIIYDPNFRSTHAPRRSDLIEIIKENMAKASIVRASDEDLMNIFDVNRVDDAWEKVRPYCGVLVYTANAKGVYLRTEKLKIRLEVEQIEPLSTIGAGDTFNAGLLYGIWKNGYKKMEIPELTAKAWEELLGNAIRFSREVCMSYDNYLPVDYAQKIKRMR
jgi:fructokinase